MGIGRQGAQIDGRGAGVGFDARILYPPQEYLHWTWSEKIHTAVDSDDDVAVWVGGDDVAVVAVGDVTAAVGAVTVAAVGMWKNRHAPFAVWPCCLVEAYYCPYCYSRYLCCRLLHCYCRWLMERRHSNRRRYLRFPSEATFRYSRRDSRWWGSRFGVGNRFNGGKTAGGSYHSSYRVNNVTRVLAVVQKFQPIVQL